MSQNLPPLPVVTPAVLRHEKARQAQQRTASASRRSAAMKELAHLMGGQTDAASALGVSKEAVSKTIRGGDRRTAGALPLADYLEIDLPRCGDQVPTLEEWQGLPAADREAAAEQAHQTWQAIATATLRMAEQARAASEWIAESALFGDADDEPCPPLARDHNPQYGPGPALITVYADIAQSLERSHRTAVTTATYWRELASPSVQTD
ncbi:hypothetical protein [Streptomyces sp. NPDC087272]|uniref:hypothetical protein n=1 Tax=Streptomyces sp. NPDC087272 TaxID=3365775 RepID=UPI0038300240